MKTTFLNLGCALACLVLTISLPRVADAATEDTAGQTKTFGDVQIRYSAISTNDLFAEVAKRYGITRSNHNGLLNIAVQKKDAAGQMQLVAANVTGKVGMLAGRKAPISFRQTTDDGGIDSIAEFALSESGTYVFDVEVRLPGQAQPFVLTFNRDYVVE